MKKYKLTVKGNNYDVSIKDMTANSVVAEVNGVEHSVSIREIESIGVPTTAFSSGNVAAASLSQTPSTPIATGTVSSADGVKSPIPGQIKSILVKVGDTVTAGQKLLILEAMKLENEIDSNKAGTIKKIHVSEGETVIQDQLLVEFN